MKLTTNGCVRLFLSARESKPHPWEARTACVACPVGAVRNGEAHNRAAEGVEAWRQCCARCQVNGRRLVGGLHCVSCYNRAREAAIGRDRKGHRPALCDELHPIEIVAVEGGTMVLSQFGCVLSAAEAMVAKAKTATGPIVFAWAPRKVAA